MKLIIFMLILYFTHLRAQYYLDHMGRSDKDKLRSLAQELVVEAKYKTHQIDGLRDECSRHISFQIGMIIGQIREKYRSMLETYRLTENKYTGKSKLNLPNIGRWRPIHYFVRMEYISALEMDIERLVHLLLTTPSFKYENPRFKP